MVRASKSISLAVKGVRKLARVDILEGCILSILQRQNVRISARACISISGVKPAKRDLETSWTEQFIFCPPCIGGAGGGGVGKGGEMGAAGAGGGGVGKGGGTGAAGGGGGAGSSNNRRMPASCGNNKIHELAEMHRNVAIQACCLDTGTFRSYMTRSSLASTLTIIVAVSKHNLSIVVKCQSKDTVSQGV